MDKKHLQSPTKADQKATTTATADNTKSAFVNNWKPDLNSQWADPDYKNTAWYRRSTADKQARINAQKDYEQYQEQIRQIAESNKGNGVGSYIGESVGDIKIEAGAEVNQDDPMEE